MEKLQLPAVTDFEAIGQDITERIYYGHEQVHPRTDAELLAFFLSAGEWELSGSLRMTYPYMSQETLSAVMRIFWTRSGAPHYDSDLPPALLVRLFKACLPEKLMSPEDHRAYLALPEKLTVYRGVTDANFSHARGLAWTTDKNEAIRHALRHGNYSSYAPHVFRATIRRKHIFAYIGKGGGGDVILNYRGLTDMEEISILDEGMNIFAFEDGEIGFVGELTCEKLEIGDLARFHRSIQRAYEMLGDLEDPEDAVRLNEVLELAMDQLCDLCYRLNFDPCALKYWVPGYDFIVTPFDPRIKDGA